MGWLTRLLLFSNWALCLSSVHGLNCNFEKDFCSYKRSHKSDYNFSWQRSSSRSGPGPKAALTGAVLGSHFLTADASKGLPIATTLTSPQITTKPQCLEFYYFIAGTNRRKVALDVLYEDGALTKSLWSRTGGEGDKWNKVQIDVHTIGSNSYKVIFKARKLDGGFYLPVPNTVLGLDDIAFTTKPCAADQTGSTMKYTTNTPTITTTKVNDISTDTDTVPSPTPTTTITAATTTAATPAATTTPATLAATPASVSTSTSLPLQANCDFEKGFCGYTRNVKVFNPYSYMWQRIDGSTGRSTPKADHTASGSYFLSAPARTNGGGTIMTSPSLAGGARCLEFYYYTAGKNQDKVLLEVLYLGNTSQLLKSYSGDKGTQWNKAEVVLPSGGDNYQIVFEAKKKSSQGIIGGADLAIDDIKFKMTSCLDDKTTLPTATTTPATISATTATTATATTSTTTATTTPATISATSTTTTTAAATGAITPTATGTTLTSITTAAQSPLKADCNFERDLCGYTLNGKNSNTHMYMWRRSDGAATGSIPESDHTTNGSFFLIAPSATRGDATILASPPLTGGARCLEFYYYAAGRNQYKVQLEVMHLGNANQLLKSYSGDKGSQWNKAEVALPSGGDNYQIIFGAKKTNGRFLSDADIAIDDIAFRMAPCLASTTEASVDYKTASASESYTTSVTGQSTTAFPSRPRSTTTSSSRPQSTTASQSSIASRSMTDLRSTTPVQMTNVHNPSTSLASMTTKYHTRANKATTSADNASYSSSELTVYHDSTPTSISTTTSARPTPQFNISTLHDCLQSSNSSCQFDFTSSGTSTTSGDLSERQWTFTSNVSYSLPPTLRSPLLPGGSTQFCLQYSYQLFGEHSELIVELTDDGVFPHHIGIAYDPTMGWVAQAIAVTPLTTDYQIQFSVTYTREHNSSDDAMLKDLILQDGPCPFVTSATTPTTVSKSDSMLMCYFHAEFCGFTHSSTSSATFQWHTNVVGGLSIVSHWGERPATASILSPKLPYTGEICLTLHISTAESVVIQISKYGTNRTVTRVAAINTHSNETSLSLSLNITSDTQLQFEAVNPGCDGDAHITYLHVNTSRCYEDSDLSLYTGSSVCPLTTTVSSPPTTTSIVSTAASTPTTTTGSTTVAPPTTVVTTPLLPTQADCDFELNFCGYSRSISSSYLFSWQRNDGSKPVGGVGPQSSHNGSYFLAADATKSLGSTTLTSPKLSRGAQCLQFYYRTFGKQGSQVDLEVTHINIKFSKLLWESSVTGTAGDSWSEVQINLADKGDNYQIKFSASKPLTKFNSAAVAVDDIRFKMSPCSDAVAVSSTTPKPAKTYVLGDCTFDIYKDLCGWTSLDTTDFDWQQLNEAGTTLFTGPDKDHSGKGYYLAMDASTPATEGTLYQLASPILTQNDTMCFTFYYYMYGNETGSLSIDLYYNDTTYRMWSLSGDQGRKWREGQVDIETDESYRIIIEGVASDGYRGDIAVDDLSIQDGPCQPKRADTTPATATKPSSSPSTLTFTLPPSTDPVTTTAAPPTTPKPDLVTTAPLTTTEPIQIFVPGDCTFDTSLGMCGWENLDTTEIHWQQQRAEDTTLVAGPNKDHSGDGYYLALDAPATTGALSPLASPILKQNCPLCFTFYYYMYGNETGNLSIDLYYNDTRHRVLSLSGDQGAEWQEGQVTIQTDKSYRIIVEADVSDGYRGGIAIDDLSMRDGPCQRNRTSETTSCSQSKPLKGASTTPTSSTPGAQSTHKLVASTASAATGKSAGQLNNTVQSTTSGTAAGRDSNKVIAIVVPVVLVALVIIVVITIFVVRRAKRRNRYDFHEYLYDDSVANSGSMGSSMGATNPVYINTAYDDHVSGATLDLDRNVQGSSSSSDCDSDG